MSDCWRAEERGKAIAIYSLAPFLGPSIGPIGNLTPSRSTQTFLTTFSWWCHNSTNYMAMDLLGHINRRCLRPNLGDTLSQRDLPTEDPRRQS